MTVWMCSGQGAQSEGMGADLLDILEVREVFERASEVLEIDLVHLAKEGSAEEVNDTFNAQALTMVLTVAIGKALMAQGKKPMRSLASRSARSARLRLRASFRSMMRSSCSKSCERDG